MTLLFDPRCNMALVKELRAHRAASEKKQKQLISRVRVKHPKRNGLARGATRPQVSECLTHFAPTQRRPPVRMCCCTRKAKARVANFQIIKMTARIELRFCSLGRYFRNPSFTPDQVEDSLERAERAGSPRLSTLRPGGRSQRTRSKSSSRSLSVILSKLRTPKSFFYVCAGLFLIVTSYTIGARTADADLDPSLPRVVIGLASDGRVLTRSGGNWALTLTGWVDMPEVLPVPLADIKLFQSVGTFGGTIWLITNDDVGWVFESAAWTNPRTGKFYLSSSLALRVVDTFRTFVWSPTPQAVGRGHAPRGSQAVENVIT